MLDQPERYRILKNLRHLCTVGFLPLEVDTNSWEIHPYRSAWKRLLCYVSFIIYSLHGLCQLLSLLHVLMFSHGTPLYQIVIHMIVVSAYALSSFWYYLLYVKYPETNAGIVAMTLTGSVIGRKCASLYLSSESHYQLLLSSQTGNFYTLEEKESD